MHRDTHFPTLVAVYLAICAGLVTSYGLFRPAYNWDVVGYVAAALSRAGLDGVDLHSRTYADIAAAAGSARFNAIVARTPYQATVATDPKSLAQHVPLYGIRHVYLWLVAAVGQITPTLAQATVTVSAIAAGVTVWVTGWPLWQRRPLLALAAPFVIYAAGLVPLARLSTPDALATLAGVTAIVTFPRYRWMSCALIAVLPLIRTDFVLLSAMLFAVRLAYGGHRLEYAAFALAGASYLWAGASVGNYGYVHIFNFTLIPNPLRAYPADMALAADPMAYVAPYLTGLQRLAGQPIWALHIGVLAYLLTRLQKLSEQEALTLAALCFAVAHFALFPAGFARSYVVTNLVVLVAVLRVAASYVPVNMSRKVGFRNV